MWIFTGKAVWLPLAFLILLVLIYKKNWRESLLILLAIVLVVTLCDQFASHVCKPVFTRFRPTHHPDFMDQVKTVFGYRGGLTDLFQPCCERFRFHGLLWHWSCGISCSAGQSFSGRLLLLIHGFISGFTSFRISCREPFRVCSSVIWSTGSILSAVRSCFLQVNNGEPLYSKKRIRLIVYAIYVTILIIIVFNVPLAACLQKWYMS